MTILGDTLLSPERDLSVWIVNNERNVVSSLFAGVVRLDQSQV